MDEHKLDLLKVSLELQTANNALLFARSMEDALRVISTQSIDIVFMTLPRERSKLFQDFFSIFRQLCLVIPIVGITTKRHSIEQFIDIGFDDFIDLKIPKNHLLHKVECLTQIRALFEESLFNRVFCTEKRAQKMVTFFFNDLSFFHEFLVRRTEIGQLKYWPVVDEMSDADLFLINIKSIRKACDCCASLRIKSMNKHKPIVLAYDKAHKDVAYQIIKQHSNIGYTDIIDLSTNPAVIAVKLNSLMKYKKMYESFMEKLKKSVHLAAIDPITDVYNRSFFEDFMRSHWTDVYDSAILIVDVDKFKNINDQFGHPFADSMLKYIASTIKKYTRTADIVARYGGDEFIIFMEGVSKEVAINIAQRIQEAVANAIFKNTNCTISIGICCVSALENLRLQDAIMVADKLMYEVKKHGGNSVRI